MAMLMLSRLILSVNSNTAQNGASIETAAYRITASSLGFSIIEEASGMAFDQASVASNITSTSQLSTTLGPETGEVYPNFNDFDDFNGLVKIDTVANSAVFKTTVVVQYVTVSGNSIVVSSTPTYNKQITVKVSSVSMSDTLLFQDVMSYWYFR